METTKETVRYYIDEQLITSEKVQGKYKFTKVEKSDFKSIREVRNMGLPIKIIKQIKENKEYCGTNKQRKSNLDMIDTELSRVDLELNKLNEERLSLLAVRKELIKKL